MELLGNYDSEEEDVDCECGPNSNSNASQSIAQGNRTRKEHISRKVVGTNKKSIQAYLPPEILIALARGDTNNDSDDDNVIVHKRPILNTNDKSATNSECKLLSLLPVPKLNDDYIAPSSSHISDSQKPKDAVASNFSFSSIQSSLKPNKPSAALNHATSSAVPQRVPLASTSAGSFEGAKQYEAFNPNTGAHQQSIFEFETEDYGPATTAQNKKKRNRELEQQLMSGDLSGIQNASITEVKADRMWDSERYNEQQQRELAIQRDFSGKGGMIAPSKTQNRKHQLNSLAMRAAQTELAMLDAQGARMKSKSETQGKYGW